MTQEIKVTINGKRYTASPGQTILEIIRHTILTIFLRFAGIQNFHHMVPVTFALFRWRVSKNWSLLAQARRLMGWLSILITKK